MRIVVVGLGVQGHKRRRIAGSECAATVDPFNADAQYRFLKDVPLAAYDAAAVCTPDAPKVELLRYLLSNGKHLLVEKPLRSERDEDIRSLERLARERRLVCYTAYNHRFEPHVSRMRELLASGVLGTVYHCRLFYGNGTARLVRESSWRDTGSGVLDDLGSHLLDTCRYWFGDAVGDFRVASSDRWENKAPDHVLLSSGTNSPRIELEMTLLMWRNHFTCDILAERGSAHIRSLCKWGPCTFTHRIRVLPSGHPPEDSVTLAQEDPTWALEYERFKAMCTGGHQTDLADDVWINSQLRRLGAEMETLEGRAS